MKVVSSYSFNYNYRNITFPTEEINHAFTNKIKYKIQSMTESNFVSLFLKTPAIQSSCAAAYVIVYTSTLPQSVLSHS